MTQIGVFDSGVGGLTVLAELVKNFSQQSFTYFGDTARAPYGEKSKIDLLAFNRQIIEFLLKNHSQLLVVACNTSCALVFDEIKALYPDIPIVGLIEAAADHAISLNPKKVIVLATPATVASHSYRAQITKRGSTIDVLEIACPEWVPIVEAGELESEAADAAVRKYTPEIQAFKPDLVIFGCSHYPYFESLLRRYLDPAICYINPAESLVPVVASLLLQTPASPISSKIDYWVSGDPQKFLTFLNRYVTLLPQPIHHHPFN